MSLKWKNIKDKSVMFMKIDKNNFTFMGFAKHGESA